MRSSPEDDATRLYVRATGGDAGAVDDLIAAYLPRLRAFVRSRLDAELRRRESDSDVVQSVCRELLAERGAFHYRGETQFRGWLFTAAANKVREKARLHGRAKRDFRREATNTEERALEGVPGDRTSPSHAALAHERVEILEAALDRLSDADREVIALARLAGLPIEEVASRVGKTMAATRKQLGRALLKLAAELEAAGVGPAT